MKVIIIGAGFTGMQLARSLTAEDNSVVVIDRDIERVNEVAGQLDCAVLHSDGNSLESLVEAGISSADALVAVTENDELNMITCSLVDSLYPRVLKIARVRNYSYCKTADATVKMHLEQDGSFRPPFGIDRMINPDVEAAETICRAISHGVIGDVIRLGDNIGIVRVTIGEDSPLIGVPLWRLSKIEGWKFLVAFVENDDGALIPNGATELKSGDRIGVLARHEDLQALLSLAHVEKSTIRKIVIVGADRVGTLIADRMTGREKDTPLARFLGLRGAEKREITLVDFDPELCRDAAEKVPDVNVLCGEVSAEGVVNEENLDDSDLVIAATPNLDRDLVIAAYMKQRGVKRTISLTPSSSVDDIARKLGVDITVPIRDTVVDSIMSLLRGRNVMSVHTVCAGEFEIVECVASENGKAAGKALKDLDLKSDFIVLLVHPADGGNCQIPRGDTVIEAGSRVVVITRPGDERAVELFGG